MTDTPTPEEKKVPEDVEDMAAWCVQPYTDRDYDLFAAGAIIEQRVISAIREAERVAVERERAACIEAAENERVSGETDNEGDFAYNNAIEHVVAAIRARGDKQDG